MLQTINKFNKLPLFFLSLIFGSLLLTPTRAHANSFTDDVAIQLINVLYGAGLHGYESTHDPYVNMLYHGGSGYVNINLDAGTSYGIAGVCDRDCLDLDITVYDPNGNVISYDTDNDRTPVAGFTTRRSGTYQVKVDMPHCRTGACYYGIGVFGR